MKILTFKKKDSDQSDWWLYIYLENGDKKEYGPRSTKQEIVDLRSAMTDEWFLKAQVNNVPGYKVTRSEITTKRHKN